MPRSPSRATLKLPEKSATRSAPGNPESRPRKPVRGGFIAPKQSVAQRARNVPEKAARPAIEALKKSGADDQRVTAPPIGQGTPRSPARSIEQANTETVSRDNKTEVPILPVAGAPQVPRIYPKRGIARSSGARALPPARSQGERRSLETTSAPITPGPLVVPVSALGGEKTVRRPLNEPPRLSKRVSEMGQCSRREADEWIENGWVRVDGVVVTTLGTRAHPKAQIEIKDEAGKHQTESVTILLNKPLDIDSGLADGAAESALQLVRAENRWSEDETRLNFKATHLRGLALVGKLDAESTGMLVFTQEGSVARRITGDDTRLEKEYMVRVEGELTPAGMNLLNCGLELDGIKLKRAQVSWQNEQQLRFVLHESRKRQIQRMCELVGLRVTSIKRIRIGSVSLGKLPAGKWRYLRDNERF